MNFSWLKRYMPRSLFGRAVLILLLPMIGLQLVVGQMFIQRHFQSVTEQMAASVILEINFAIEQVARFEDPQAGRDIGKPRNAAIADTKKPPPAR